MLNDNIGQLIQQESKRQKRVTNLIASENFVSEDVLKTLGSVLINKYAEGYPGKRYYAGNAIVDKIERICQERALKLFKLLSRSQRGKWHVNVQPYSGSPANLAVYSAFVPLGGKIMGMSLDVGGHLTHGHKVSFTGKAWKQISYGVDKKTELIDYNEILKIAKRAKPKLIVAGATSYSRQIDFKKFRRIADEIGAYLMVDMAHIAGLIAAGVHPSPFCASNGKLLADVVTTTIHKTLRGPRAGMIFCRKEFVDKIDRAVFPGLQGGPHINQIAATAVALKEAARPSFKKYCRQVVKNAKTLAAELQKMGWRIISSGTDTHLFLVDTSQRGISGGEASKKLEKKGIVVNKNTIPLDKRKPLDPSGIRIGTPAVTTIGMKEKDMIKIAQRINKILL